MKGQTILFLLIRGIAVISVLVMGVLDKPQCALVPIVMMILYTIFGLITSHRDRTKIEAVADQVYFVGYLSTIAAFAGVILRIFVMRKMPEDPLPVLLMGGVALVTTVLGLLVMTTLKDYALSLNKGTAITEPEWKEKMLEAVEALIKINDTSLPVSNSEGSRMLIAVSGKAEKAIEELNEQLMALRENVRKLKNHVEIGADSAGLFVKNVEQLQAVLNNFVMLLEVKLELESRKFDDGM
jgi:hypothetical protein